jgi:hypothetical protein
MSDNDCSISVRLIGTERNRSNYFYFPGTVGLHRAAELAAMHAHALCVQFDYMELRPDAYPRLAAPPALVADVDGNPVLSK